MASKLKKVCIIGTGLAGIVSLRSLLPFTSELKVIAYEQTNRVGGLWIYGDPYKLTNMYKNLRTNLPKELMTIPGVPFPESLPISFIGHIEYLNYLEDLTSKLHLDDFIKFRTEVIKVSEIGSGFDAFYEIETKDLEANTFNTEIFDSVIICSGHYTVPLIPDIPGQDTFTGKITHSVDYREPETFEDLTVLLLGARSSGIDLAIDISGCAMKVLLSHNNPKNPTWFPDNVEQISGISRIDQSDIHLKDGSVVTADVIVYATGYRYEYPFLEKGCQPKSDPECLSLLSLYRDIIDIDHPSIYYIALNKIVAPAPQIFAQCEFVVALITGKITLPSREEMERHNAETFEKRVVQKSGLVRHYNIHANLQWEYNDELLSLAGQEPLGPVYRKLYNHVWLMRRWNSQAYREAAYRIVSDDNFKVLKLPDDVPDSIFDECLGYDKGLSAYLF